MWRCKNCSEEVEGTFNACWNCGFSRDGLNVNYSEESSSISRVLSDGTILSEDASRDAVDLDGKGTNRTKVRGVHRSNVADSGRTLPESKTVGQAMPRQITQGLIGKDKLVACSACGNLISRKADFCPACGHKPRNSASGCFVWLFKFVFGLAGAILGLSVAMHFLFGSGQTTQRDYASEIETKCREQAAAFPYPTGRKEFFDSCVSGAYSALRSKGVIK